MVTAVARPQKSPSTRRKPGRPRVFRKPRYCKKCGKRLEVDAYRVRNGGGNYCLSCFNLLFRPPMLISGKIRKQAGGPVCPHCHSYKQIYLDDGDYYCRVCGCLVTSLIIFPHP